MKLCADRETSWINHQLLDIYYELYKKGSAFSVEIWMNDKLVGGLFGVAVGSCFCGESMFSLATNGSKLALVATMARLIYAGFKLFDTQFPNKHLQSMGGCAISQSKYEILLSDCIDHHCDFLNFPVTCTWSELIQLNNHTL